MVLGPDRCPYGIRQTKLKYETKYTFVFCILPLEKCMEKAYGLLLLDTLLEVVTMTQPEPSTSLTTPGSGELVVTRGLM